MCMGSVNWPERFKLALDSLLKRKSHGRNENIFTNENTKGPLKLIIQ